MGVQHAQLFVYRSRRKRASAGTLKLTVVRWLRQSFARKRAELALYEYRWPRARNDMPPIVKTLETDGKGVFDFGPLRTGHYTLVIDGEDSFDVEIKELPQVTERSR